jgi:hypothetical protein
VKNSVSPTVFESLVTENLGFNNSVFLNSVRILSRENIGFNMGESWGKLGFHVSEDSDTPNLRGSKSTNTGEK